MEDALEGARIKQKKGLLFSNPLCDLGRIFFLPLFTPIRVKFDVILAFFVKKMYKKAHILTYVDKNVDKRFAFFV